MTAAADLSRRPVVVTVDRMPISRIATLAALAVCALIVAGVLSAARQEAPAKRAYLLVQADITNPDRYAEYAKVAPDIVAKYGGRYLARGGRTVALEGPLPRSRVVVLEFPSVEAAERFYRSPEYTAARKLREGASQAQFIVVEAL
jgi:uncharacterized protein (DUF1330 family)